MAELKTLYAQDFSAWSRQQAEALCAAARAGSHQPLDWQNLAEEIEGLGISQRLARRSQIRRIIRRLAKLAHSRAIDPRRGWIESINDARADIEDWLELSPSLKTELDREITAQSKRAIELAIRGLRDHGETQGGDLARVRASSDTEEQITRRLVPRGAAGVTWAHHTEIRGDISRSRPYL